MGLRPFQTTPVHALWTGRPPRHYGRCAPVFRRIGVEIVEPQGKTCGNEQKPGKSAVVQVQEGGGTEVKERVLNTRGGCILRSHESGDWIRDNVFIARLPDFLFSIPCATSLRAPKKEQQNSESRSNRDTIVSLI